MIKFEFNYLEKTLYIHQPGSPRRSITKTFTTGWGSPGFILEPNNHWITFTAWPNKIRAFYKCVKTEELETWPADLAWEDQISFRHYFSTSNFRDYLLSERLS